MKTYSTFRAAVRDMPNALADGPCGDVVGIETQARRDCENPMAILRDMVNWTSSRKGKATTGLSRSDGFATIGIASADHVKPCLVW
jgi:hypothetical protein